MGKPLVSVLIANHNNSSFIEETLDSVINQTYPNIEIIVVDDASSDNSVEVIENYMHRNPDKNIFFYQTYCSFGCGRVKRKCADIARGEYFAFLDPDDTIAVDAVEKLVSAHELGKYSIVYSSHYLCNVQLQVQSVSTWVGKIPEGQSNLTSASGHISAFAMCRKECYDQTEGINPKYVVAEDQDMYFKMEEVAPVCFFDEPLYFYRKHDHNMSFDKSREVRNLYWLLQCKEAAYRRRKDNKLQVQNTTKHELYRLQLDYQIAKTKCSRDAKQPWLGDFLKVLIYTPFSFRKGVRGIKNIFSHE